jgi:hypothetical protein
MRLYVSVRSTEAGLAPLLASLTAHGFDTPVTLTVDGQSFDVDLREYREDTED